MDVGEHKSALRKKAMALRKTAHLAGAQSAAQALSTRILASGLSKGHDIIAGYYPIRTEIDPMPLLAALSMAGHGICLPVIQGAGKPLAFCTWHPQAEMIEGPYGARVPASGEWVEPSLLIVPLVAFDRAGSRLGYGGGFYDRTLARLRGVRPTQALGVAYAAQEVACVPTEPTDARLDGIATEKYLIWPGENQ